MFILFNLSNSGFLSLVSTAVDDMERYSKSIFLFFQEHVFCKLQANSDDLFETPDLVVSCKDEDVVPDLKLVIQIKPSQTHPSLF